MDIFYSSIAVISNEIHNMYESNITHSFIEIVDLNQEYLKNDFNDVIYRVIGDDSQIINNIPEKNQIIIKHNNNWIMISYVNIKGSNITKFNICIMDDPFDQEHRLNNQIKKLSHKIQEMINTNEYVSEVMINNPHFNFSNQQKIIDLINDYFNISEFDYAKCRNERNLKIILEINDMYIIITYPILLESDDLIIKIAILHGVIDANYYYTVI